MTKARLQEAYRNKKDEFYTEYATIENEMPYYAEYFHDKVIYCNCDDIRSNFVKYFVNNLTKYHIRKLVATALNTVNKHAYKHCWEERNGKVYHYKYPITGNGSFDSKEAIATLKKSDILITNPPFSNGKAGRLIQLAIKYHKQFLILGPQTLATNKIIFEPLLHKQVWFGASIHGGDVEFQIPNDYSSDSASIRIGKNGEKFVRVTGIRWFTNMNHHCWKKADTGKMKPESMEDYLYKHYYGAIYDNYPMAIEIPLSNAVPANYSGQFGVPVTWLDYYNPESFDIVRIRKGLDGKDLRVNGEEPFCRLIVERRRNVQYC